MASNTPKLGLYMKDPVADGNDFFDIKTMMNDNWEKIDGFAGGMDEVKERLNTISRQDVTLQSGVQIINAAKSASFSLSGITGRMLVNLLGRLGGCEAVSSWSSNVAITLDSTNKTSGSSSFKLTLGSVPATASASFLTAPGKKYIAVADVKNGNTSKVAISINGIAGAIGNYVAAASAFAPSVVRFAATDYFHIVTVTGTGNSGNTFNMDSVRVYEVSEADYAAAASLTPAQTAAKYPYVDSVMPVRNPYAIRWTDANKTDVASMLALQTDLYADPVTGSNADTVFERDGQYFKTKNWHCVVLGGSEDWRYSDTRTGYKVVSAMLAQPSALYSTSRQNITKYDGKLLSIGASSNGEDYANYNGVDNSGYDRQIFMSISVADSGWGDSYTPTADEIKAYFNGWKMKQWGEGNTTPYTSGTKEWVQILDPVIPGGTTTLPTTQAPNWTPYQLVYQLATPTVEPIVSEGQLTFTEGDNQVEVGTGIILREKANVGKGVNWFINHRPIPSTRLAHDLEKFIYVYKGGKIDNTWVYKAGGGSAYGKLFAESPSNLIDLTEPFTVTYTTLDKSPVSPFVGSYSANEKTLLLDLVDSVQQNTARVSVLENKKAEKDKVVNRITPTLLNGWLNYDTTRGALSYFKDDQGIVHVDGFIKGGSTTFGAAIFGLPPGYRSGKPMEIPVTSASASASLAGTVYVGANSVHVGFYVANTWLAIKFSFLAEQ